VVAALVVLIVPKADVCDSGRVAIANSWECREISPVLGSTARKPLPSPMAIVLKDGSSGGCTGVRR